MGNTDAGRGVKLKGVAGDGHSYNISYLPPKQQQNKIQDK